MQQSQDLKNSQVSNYALAFFILTRFIAFAFSFPCYTDVFHYLDYFNKIWVQGLQPYAQFHLEYPPLVLIFISLPRIFAQTINENHYYIFFALSMMLVDCVCLKTCKFYCKNRLKMTDTQINRMTIFYALFGLLLFRLLYHRLDLVVALLFVLSLTFFDSKSSRLKTSFFFNNIFGFFYKIIPVIIVPIAIIFKAFATSTNPQKAILIIIKNSLIFVLTIAAIIFALEIYTDHHFIEDMLFHQNRGIQIESTYASFLIFKNLLLEKISPISNNYGSWNIATSYRLDLTTKYLGHFILLLFYAAIFLQFTVHKKIKISEEKFFDATLVAIFLFISFQRVLSPQFFIWLIPISSIYLAQNRSIWLLLGFSFLFFATFLIFSIDYIILVNEEPILVTALFLRNLLLLIFSGFLTLRFFKKLK